MIVPGSVPPDQITASGEFMVSVATPTEAPSLRIRPAGLVPLPMTSAPPPLIAWPADLSAYRVAGPLTVLVVVPVALKTAAAPAVLMSVLAE